MSDIVVEQMARAFHETYERLAPSFGYETRKASAAPWEQVPENNRKLMIATVAEATARLRDELAGWNAALESSAKGEGLSPLPSSRDYMGIIYLTSSSKQR